MTTDAGKRNLRDIGAGLVPGEPTTLALTAIALDFTWTGNDPAKADGTATIDDGDTVGDDNDAGDAISAIEDQYNKLLVDVTALRAVLVAHGFIA